MAVDPQAPSFDTQGTIDAQVITNEQQRSRQGQSNENEERDVEVNTMVKTMTQSSLNEPYSVFSKSKKLTIVAISSTAGILSTISANIYFPALTIIEKDLHTTTELVNLTVTVYMIFQGISPAFWGSLSDAWGRRPVYLSTIVVYMGSCIGLALAPSYAALLVLRMLQAFGSSSVIAIGAGVISDIASPSERGTYSGIFSCMQMLGPVLGPILGGVISQAVSWRWIFWLLLIISGVMVTIIFFFLPETLRSLVGNGSGYANPTPIQWLQHRMNSHHRRQSCDTGHDPVQLPKTSELAKVATQSSIARMKKIPNPLRPLSFLLQPDVAAALTYNALHYAVYYCYLTSLPSLFSQLYGLNQLQQGLCFIVQGVGCISGSLVEGRILDRDFRITAKRVGQNVSRSRLPLEFPIFKARLRTAWIHGLLFQLVTIAYGWSLYANAHMAVPLVLQFITGFTITSLFNVFQTMMIDLFPGKGASVTASNNLVRCLLGAAATVAIEPGIQGVGVGWIFTILGLILVVSNLLLVLLIRYGTTWRTRRAHKNASSNEKHC